jgi:hypothetical protein
MMILLSVPPEIQIMPEMGLKVSKIDTTYGLLSHYAL